MLRKPLTAYRFEFAELVVKRGSSQRCRPGVAFYATTLGAGSDAEAWRLALIEFCRAINPNDPLAVRKAVSR